MTTALESTFNERAWAAFQRTYDIVLSTARDRCYFVLFHVRINVSLRIWLWHV
jgi:hypothetical protein